MPLQSRTDQPTSDRPGQSLWNRMVMSHRFAAGAIEAAVFAACPAIARDLLTEMFASPVQPDGEIVFGQTQFRRDFAGILSFEINALKQFPVLFRNGGQQPFEALAKQTLLAGVCHLGQFLLKPFQRPSSRGVAAVEVNDGAAQYPVEPRHGVFLPGRRSGRGQRLDKAILHHVFRQIWISDTAAGEGHKGLQVLEQRFFDALHVSDTGGQVRLRKAVTKRLGKMNA